MSSLIKFNNIPCSHCIKCLKVCPQDAISIQEGIVTIDEEKCIHCGACIEACQHNKLSIQEINLEKTLKEFEYTIAFIPTSILSDMNNYEEMKQVAYAIKQLGFDEVRQYSDIEGFLYKQANLDASGKEIVISSLCPTINEYIVNEYPTLADNLLPYEYPEEILAKQLKEKYKDKKLGIYNLCPCVSKMTLSKYPYGNTNSNIDYAIGLSHLFPKIHYLQNECKIDIDMCKSGVSYNTSDLYGRNTLSTVSLTGLEQIKEVLELVEFDQLKHIDLLALYACHQGCVGGHFLWSNPIEGMVNIERMFDELKDEISNLDKETYYKDRVIENTNTDMKERIAWFEKVNAILDTLPQFDCGSCGYANCRNLACKIADNQVDDSLCLVKKR